MAEYLFRLKLDQLGLAEKFDVFSRSLSTEYEPPNSPASPQGVQVLRVEYGIDSSMHRSKLLTEEDVTEACLIIPVTKKLGIYMQGMYPNAMPKIKFFEIDIFDPWHQPVSVFKMCAELISSELDKLFERKVI